MKEEQVHVSNRSIEMEPQPHERVIVALDVPTAEKALELVEELDGLISFFKLGLELLMAGELGGVMRQLTAKKVFIDIKLPNDIPTTARKAVESAPENVRFMTLSHDAMSTTIHAAREGRGSRKWPELLAVPLLSSVGPSEFAAIYNRPASDLQKVLVERATLAKAAGADGFIVSGDEILLLRNVFPDVPLVSPGIRPAWWAHDDHKRVCTPSKAIELGADYIVVGRPITKQATKTERLDAARRIVDEVVEAKAPRLN